MKSSVTIANGMGGSIGSGPVSKTSNTHNY